MKLQDFFTILVFVIFLLGGAFMYRHGMEQQYKKDLEFCGVNTAKTIEEQDAAKSCMDALYDYPNGLRHDKE